MLTRNRALFGLLAAALTGNAGCDFDGSNTPPQSEPDLTLDGSPADAPVTTGDDAAIAHDAAPAHDASNEASIADATVDGSIADAEPAAEAATIDAGPEDAGSVGIGVDVATQTTLEAGVDATMDVGIDAGVDASPVGAVDAGDSGTTGTPTGSVTMTITGPAGPESGVPIVFHDPYGNQIGVGTTDMTGAVSMTVPAGSMVTAIFGTPDQPTLVSIAGVQPGDAIPLVDPTQHASFSASPNIQPPDSTPPGAASQYLFIVADACSTQIDSPSGVSVDIDSRCVGPNGLFPVLLLAEDGAGDPVAFAFKDDNPIGENGADTPDVSIGGTFMTGIGTEAIETSTSADQDGLSPSFASVRQIADGVSYTEQEAVNVNGDGSSETILTLEPGFASAIQTEVDLVGDDVSLVAVASHETAPAGSATDEFDLSQLPPEIIGSSIDASHVDTPIIAWQSTSPLDYGTAGIIVSASWSGNDNGQLGTWILVVPSTVTSASPPALTDSVAAYAPVADAEWPGPASVVAFGGTLAPNYDVFRDFAGAVIASFEQPANGSTPVVPVLPGNGTVTVSVYPFDY